MSLDFTPLQWQQLSHSLHSLLNHHIQTLIQPQIHLQQQRILSFHKEREDPLELHDMHEYFHGGQFDVEEFEDGGDDHLPQRFITNSTLNPTAFTTADTTTRLPPPPPPSKKHIPKIYGLFEFISELELKRFSLGEDPPELALINVEECAPLFGMEMAMRMKGEMESQQHRHHQMRQGVSGGASFGGVASLSPFAHGESNVRYNNRASPIGSPATPGLQFQRRNPFHTPSPRQHGRYTSSSPNLFHPSPTLSHISEAPSLYSTSTNANWRLSFGPMTEILLRYYEQKNRQHSLSHLKSLQKETSLKTVIGSKQLPSRMNGQRAPNVDYSTVEHPKTRKSPVKNLPTEIKEVLELLGEGVTVRALVRYDSNAEIDIDTTIALNEPVLKFLEIPISVHLYNVKIEAEIVATYHVDTDVADIFLERNPTTLEGVNFGDTPIKDFDLTVDIGDPALGPVLRDKKKIGGFIKEAMRDILGKKAIYPHQVSLERVLEKALKNFGSTENENGKEKKQGKLSSNDSPEFST